MHRGSIARVAGLALLWGSGFLWIKLSLDGFAPIHIVLIRLSLGAVVLIALLYAVGDRLPTGLRTWAHLAVAALMANVLPYLLFAVGEQQVDSAVAGMLNATTPVWTVAIAFLVGLERRPTYKKVAGFALGLTGTTLIFSPWQGGSQYTSWGAVACLTAALCYAVSYVYMDRYLVRRGTSPLALSAAQLGAASVIAAVLVPIVGGLKMPSPSPTALVSVVILGVFGTGAAYVLNYRIITDDGASVASVVVYLLPIVAISLGAVVLGEAPTAAALLGTAVILAGVWLVRWQRQRVIARPTPPAS
jgi:drug/metabolite transporter (DMT)-like permease